MEQYIGIAAAAFFGLTVAVAMTAVSFLFGPKRSTQIKSEPFECGMPPAMQPKAEASVNFYLIAVLFVMFDIEIVFLYPWAVSARTLGPEGLAAMGFFVLVLLAGLAYAVKRGALKWD